MNKYSARFGRIAATTAVAAMALGAVAFASDSKAQAIEEDSPGWSCVDDGNRICGPGNPQGAPAGCYDDGGVIVAPWPCYVVVNPDGSSDVYGEVKA